MQSATPTGATMRAFFLISSLLSGCDDPGGSAADCATGGVGSLDLALDLPAAGWLVPPQVSVWTPEGELVGALAESGVLADLPAGPYYVAAERGITAPDGDLTGRAWGLLADTVSLACVADGEPTPLALAYEEQPSGGRLWVTSGESVAAFSAAQLEAGGDQEPTVKLDIPLTNDLRGLAFDGPGNLWTAASPTYGARLMVFEPGQLGASGEPAAALELTSDLLDEHASINELAFGADGTLWVLVSHSDASFGGLIGFTAAQARAALAEGADGRLEPAHTVPLPVAYPSDLLADGAGGLWVSGQDDDTIYLFDEDALRAGDATPVRAAKVLAEDGSALRGPTDLAWSASGDLAIDFWTSGTFATVSAEAIEGGSAEIAGALLLRSDVMDLPAGLEGDAQGRLWYGNYTGSDVGALQSFRGAADEPAAVSSSATLAPDNLRFDPLPF